MNSEMMNTGSVHIHASCSPDITTGTSSDWGINKGDNGLGLCDGKQAVPQVVGSSPAQEIDCLLVFFP